MVVQPRLLHGELADLVGTEHVRIATAADMIDAYLPQLVVEPGDVEEISRVLGWANEGGVRVIPRGGGTKLGWGNVPRRGDIVLSMCRLDRVLEHAWGDMTASAQAGCSVATFNAHLAEHGQQLALDVLWPEQATIGGVLATNDGGALRLRYGSLRDLLIGITIVLPDGTIARSGGKVVKNVAGYDLPKLLTGSLGTLAVIVDATFRLYPLPQTLQTVTIRAPGAAAANKLMLAVLDSTLVPVGLQLRASSAEPPEVDICFAGSNAAIEVQRTQLTRLVQAAGCGDQAVTDDLTCWQAREALWGGDPAAVVCKVSILPGQQTDLLAELARLGRPLQLQWSLVAQALGVGTMCLRGPNEQAMLAGLNLLRRSVEGLGGSLVVLSCPVSIKEHLDVWGTPPDAIALMRRVKDHFDPKGVLNYGRFVGGI